jgi:hypothetical protein
MSAGGDLFLTGGLIDLKNDGSNVSQIKFYCESSNAHAQTLIGAPHSESATNTLTLPSTGGNSYLLTAASTATLTNKTLTAPTLTGTTVAASFDISGDIDVDGTANLDVVDIDGAVDMASTLQVDGAITSSAGATITVADNSTNLQLKSTDADANVGPTLVLLRHSASPADDDVLGHIAFNAMDDADQQEDLVVMEAIFSDVTNGSEDVRFYIDTKIAGTNRNRLEFNPNQTVVNEDAQAIDFRVETDNDPNFLKVFGGDRKLGIASFSATGQSSGSEFNSDGKLTISGAGSSSRNMIGFYNTNVNVGNIVTNGSATSYTTSSDYRLKENVSYTFDATTRLKQLKPARFNFKSDDTTTMDGFLAHEVSSIVPEAVTGAKDETETLSNVVVASNGTALAHGKTEASWTQGKADGIYPANSTWASSHTQDVNQSIDQAKLVPLLVKTIQELEARITTLEG